MVPNLGAQGSLRELEDGFHITVIEQLFLRKVSVPCDVSYSSASTWKSGHPVTTRGRSLGLHGVPCFDPKQDETDISRVFYFGQLLPDLLDQNIL